MKTYVVTLNLNPLGKTELMKGHKKISFCGKIWKIIPKISLLAFLSGALNNKETSALSTEIFNFMLYLFLLF